jgi:hypothetical protein
MNEECTAQQNAGKSDMSEKSCLTTLDKKSEVHIITIRQSILADLVPRQINEN